MSIKCTVVISRDYKLGNNTLELDNLKEIFTYLLIENTYYGITGFKFVYEYVTGSIINEEKVKKNRKLIDKDNVKLKE